MLGWFGFMFDLLLLHYCSSLLVGLASTASLCTFTTRTSVFVHDLDREVRDPGSCWYGQSCTVSGAQNTHTHTHMFILVISRFMLAFLTVYVIMHIEWLLRVLGVIWISC